MIKRIVCFLQLVAWEKLTNRTNVSHTTYNQPLELIFSDLYGPFPGSSTFGFNYYMSFVDAYSKFTWLYLLKSKVEASSTFKQFKSLVELQHGFPIKVVSLFLDLPAHKLDVRS